MPKWDDSRMIGFDFETSGKEHEYALQPWRIAQGATWATNLVWARKSPSLVENHLFPDHDHMERMLLQAIQEDATLVGWNTTFDVSILIAYGFKDLVTQVKWLDGMLLWRHLSIEPEYEISTAYNRKSYSLKDAVKEFFPKHGGYEDDVDFHATDRASLKKLGNYNVRDVVFTMMVAKHIWGLLTERQQKCALVEAACIPQVAEANLNGMPVDTLAAAELRQWLTDTADKQLAELNQHGVTEKVIRSPMQLARLMFGHYDVTDDEAETHWGLTPFKTNTSKKTGRVTNSTDKEVMHELVEVDERVAKLRAYRESLNNRTKFADAPMISAAYNGDGRTRPAARIFGTYSGRFTYSSKQGRGVNAKQTGWALHQGKRDQIFRDILIAPPGHTIVEFDAAGQEFRWMAIASNDPIMLGLCEPGEDPHSYMGAQVRRVNYQALMMSVRQGDKTAKDARQLGKVGNLSLQYRTSAKKLRSVARVQYRMPMTLSEAETVRTTYLKTYRKVPEYWARQIAETRKSGYVETFAGRRVHVTGDWAGTWGWSMGSTAINYRIQGTGADQKYLAMKHLREIVESTNAKFAWDLHDGLYFYVPDQEVTRFVEGGAAILDNLPYEDEWGFTPPIPLPWDCKYGKSWGSLKEV